MVPPPNEEGLIGRLRAAARWRLERWRSLRGLTPNPIRDWSGNLDPSESLEKHLEPLRHQLASGTPHEADFGFFSTLEGVDGLFVDVGANVGQSAVSLRAVNRSLRIISFEPNPFLEPVLRHVGEELLERFEYRMIGLSDTRKSMVLYVPLIDGIAVTPLATLDPSLFDREAHHRYLRGLSLHGSYEIEEVAVELERLDDLGLEPTVIKIDTEEHELACLAGMTETIDRYSPILMIESNPQRERIDDRLERFGYHPFTYDAGARKLLPFGAQTQAVNVFYVRDGHTSGTVAMS